MDTPELHHIVVNSWDGGVDAEQNVVLVSIPSVLDPRMAPPGKHTLHAYVPATEPWDLWKGGGSHDASRGDSSVAPLALRETPGPPGLTRLLRG